jgi:phospholipid/cholesterol/gamma-HCH transport system ATP-binding protein
MIKLVDVRKKFGSTWVTKGVSLEIPENKITCIIGRSGEGKSVLLKQMIGLIRPTSGSIFVGGVDITKLSEDEIEENFQHYGYVFQFAALLDSLNVFENIGITLLEQGESKEKVLSVVKEKLAMVHLKEDTLYKYPSELSGGMRKRVGLARTLIRHPRYMLYDEPTTGLDPITSRIIHQLMFDVQKKYNFTSVVISHDIEIFKYVDYVALLYDGKIHFFGEAKTIWESDNPYVYQFIRGLPSGPIPTEMSHLDEK